MRYLNYLALSLSVSVSAIASQPIEIESPASGRKVFRDLEKFEEEAWSLAYAGEHERAGRYLRHAAGQGSRLSALFLAQEYKNGGLIFQENPNEAEFFMGVYEDLKSKVKDKFWIRFDDGELQKHSLRIKNSALARVTPWLAAAYSLIQAKAPDRYKQASENPKYAMELLLELILDERIYLYSKKEDLTNKEKARAVEIIREGAISLNEQALFTKVFELLGKGYRKVDFLPQVLAIAQASPFHSEQEKADIDLVVGDNVASLQSDWYPQLVGSLCSVEPAVAGRGNPFELVKSAMNSLAKDQKLAEEKREPLLALCDAIYRQLRAVSLKSDFAKVLDDGSWSSTRNAMPRLRLLRIIVADEGLRSHRREELLKRTNGVLDGLYCEMMYNDSHEESEKARAPFFDGFNVFYDLDSAQALGYLKKRYQEKDERQHRDFRLDVLLTLKGRDEEFYQTEAQKALSEHLDDLIELLIGSSERRQRAEGSLVSLDTAYTRMCQVLSQTSREKEDKEAERAHRAFETFVSSKDLLEAYAAQLAPQLETFLANHSSLSFRYSDLLSQGPVTLRYAAFQALITYLVKEKPENRPYFHFTTTADDLFKKDSRKFGYISDKPPAFFHNAFESLSAVRADYPIQRMWQAMDARDQDVRLEMVKQIRAYFNLPAEVVEPEDEADKSASNRRESPLLKCHAIVGQSLIECMGSNSLPHSALHEFCEAAKLTGLYGNLPAEVLASLGDQVFWNQDAPLAQRCEAFNNILRRSAVKGELSNLRAICQERLPESPLLSYVLLALQMIEATPKTSYAMYGLMAKMTDLKKANPEIHIPNNFILGRAILEHALEEGQLSVYPWSPRDFTELYNMKEYHSINRHDENAPYVAVDSSLSSLTLDEEGSLYGMLYDCNMRGTEGFNYYRFYKCDPYTGYAKWSMILSHNPKARDILDSGRPKYTVGSQYVYVMSGNNKVVVFDRTSGEYVRDMTSSDVDPNVKLNFIGAVGENLFRADVWESGSRKIDSKASLSFFPHGNAQGNWSLHLPQTGGGRYRFSTNGAYFVCTGYGSSVKHFFNASGKNVAIDGDPSASADEHFKHQPAATVNGDMLYYTQKQGEKSYQLVHLNLVTGDELWRAPLLGEPKQAPVLSVNKDCVFMLFEKDLCALSISPDAPGSLLWQVSTRSKDSSFFNKFDHIEVSADGQYVYGLESNTHTFYRYDVKTGAEEDLGKFSHGRSAGLIGSRADGKVFVKPHYY